MKIWLFVLPLALLAIAFVALPIWWKRSSASTPGVPQPAHADGKSLSGLWISLVVTGFVVCVALAAYVAVGRPDLLAANVAVVPPPMSSPNQAPSPPSMADMIGQLQTRVQQSPKNADAWQSLGWAYMHVRKPAEAAEAYKHAVALAPDDMTYRSALVEATIQSGDGRISPQAVLELRKIETKIPGDPRTRFYLAMYKDQQGDHKGALADWIALLKSAPAGAGWAAEVRGIVEKVAQEEHIDLSGQLPPQSAEAQGMPPAMPGPNAEQVAAAQQMSAGDRSAMIQGMVERLASELKQNPHNADGWQRLMRARMVLGEKDRALAAYRDARNAFASEPTQLAAIDEVAKSLGVLSK